MIPLTGKNYLKEQCSLHSCKFFSQSSVSIAVNHWSTKRWGRTEQHREFRKQHKHLKGKPNLQNTDILKTRQNSVLGCKIVFAGSGLCTGNCLVFLDPLQSNIKQHAASYLICLPTGNFTWTWTLLEDLKCIVTGFICPYPHFFIAKQFYYCLFPSLIQYQTHSRMHIIDKKRSWRNSILFLS